jgi:hypothetical protein
MIDRQNRNRLISAITRYMNEEITAFAFDDEIQQIPNQDATIRFVVGLLWYHYDDCKDHLAGLSKEEWDYFQRLILLLQSDSEIESHRKWSVRQLVAGIAILGFGLCVVQLGLGWHLVAVAIVLGPVSMLISYWKRHAMPEPTPQQVALIPYSSFAELRAVRRRVVGFSKRQYPRHATLRNVHGPLATAMAWMNMYILWFIGSPLVLLFQTLPEKETTIRIGEGAV